MAINFWEIAYHLCTQSRSWIVIVVGSEKHDT